MKKFLVFIMSVFVALSLAACSQQEDVEEEPQFLDVQLNASPVKAKVNEEITFEAKVTYGEEEVKDAEEVEFEIWRAHAEEHEKVLVEHGEKGIYRLKKSFSEEGTYYIISHVSARSMHSMPRIEFIVGAPSEPEQGDDPVEEDTSAENNSQQDSDEEEHSGH